MEDFQNTMVSKSGDKHKHKNTYLYVNGDQ